MKPTLVLDEQTLRELQASPLFSHVSPESIRRCLAQGEETSFAPGQLLVRDGQEVPAFIIQLDGELRVIKRYPSQAGEGGEQEVLLKTTRPGDFMGEIPLLLQAPLDVDVVATKPTRAIMLGPDAFWAMLGSCPVTSRVILRAMAYRIRNKESFNQQREKLASLGTMAAGLAHELNNPASAARRAVDGLEPAIQNWHARSLRLAALRAAQEAGETGRGDDGTAGGDQLARLEGDALARAGAAAGQKLDALLQSEREDEVAHWLDARGVEESWQLAPTFVQAGLDPAWLENFARALPAALLTEAVCWLEASLTVRSLLRDAGHSIERVSELVKAVKSYTYLDRAQAQQEVNVHEGLETTLTMLGHKLKGVEVIREFDRTLPLVCAYGTELNQVWTNLLDNAADAVSRQPHGRIRLRTHRDDENHVCVEIADNGGGIPPEIKRRLFEPFFTTKEVGKGSGLGLVISHRIIAERHGGEIEVLDHTPGETCFSVRLPIRRARNAAAAVPTDAPTLAGRPTEWTDPPMAPGTGPAGS